MQLIWEVTDKSSYQVVSWLNFFGYTIHSLRWLEFQDIEILVLLYRF